MAIFRVCCLFTEQRGLVVLLRRQTLELLRNVPLHLHQAALFGQRRRSNFPPQFVPRNRQFVGRQGGATAAN